MAVKTTNIRRMITLSKKQDKWLSTTAKKLNMTYSKFIKFLIDKNISNLISKLPKKELDEIIKIAKTPWLDFNEIDTISDEELEELLNEK